MASINKFKRYELKYLLSYTQYQNILKEVENYLHIDKYKETTIQSLYFDNESFLLIRNSIERPLYKEKLRARSYGLVTGDDLVFLELKKKFEKVVYKRRIEIKEKYVEDFINCDYVLDGQIPKEINYFCSHYKNLKPRLLVLYDRVAYIDDNSDLRITFDKNVRYRLNNLNLHTSLNGNKIINDDQVLMEIKTSLGYPNWLIKILNENKAYKTRFSKYGKAYAICLKNKALNKEDKVNV